MSVLDILNSDLILPGLAVLVIVIYVTMRIRNNRKFKR